ncbi:TPA: hypothetical protein I9517_001599 [Legionella pneumophila]|nr:hypothetical protein [Legionella pneumophila]
MRDYWERRNQSTFKAIMVSVVGFLDEGLLGSIPTSSKYRGNGFSGWIFR